MYTLTLCIFSRAIWVVYSHDQFFQSFWLVGNLKNFEILVEVSALMYNWSLTQINFWAFHISHLAHKKFLLRLSLHARARSFSIFAIRSSTNRCKSKNYSYKYRSIVIIRTKEEILWFLRVLGTVSDERTFRSLIFKAQRFTRCVQPRFSEYSPNCISSGRVERANEM